MFIFIFSFPIISIEYSWCFIFILLAIYSSTYLFMYPWYIVTVCHLLLSLVDIFILCYLQVFLILNYSCIPDWTTVFLPYLIFLLSLVDIVGATYSCYWQFIHQILPAISKGGDRDKAIHRSIVLLGIFFIYFLFSNFATMRLTKIWGE